MAEDGLGAADSLRARKPNLRHLRARELHRGWCAKPGVGTQPVASPLRCSRVFLQAVAVTASRGRSSSTWLSSRLQCARSGPAETS